MFSRHYIPRVQPAGGDVDAILAKRVNDLGTAVVVARRQDQVQFH
jgi:hypothetical protein